MTPSTTVGCPCPSILPSSLLSFFLRLLDQGLASLFLSNYSLSLYPHPSWCIISWPRGHLLHRRVTDTYNGRHLSFYDQRLMDVMNLTHTTHVGIILWILFLWCALCRHTTTTLPLSLWWEQTQSLCEFLPKHLTKDPRIFTFRYLWSSGSRGLHETAPRTHLILRALSSPAILRQLWNSPRALASATERDVGIFQRARASLHPWGITHLSRLRQLTSFTHFLSHLKRLASSLSNDSPWSALRVSMTMLSLCGYMVLTSFLVGITVHGYLDPLLGGPPWSPFPRSLESEVRSHHTSFAHSLESDVISHHHSRVFPPATLRPTGNFFTTVPRDIRDHCLPEVASGEVSFFLAQCESSCTFGDSVYSSTLLSPSRFPFNDDWCDFACSIYSSRSQCLDASPGSLDLLECSTSWHTIVHSIYSSAPLFNFWRVGHSIPSRTPVCGVSRHLDHSIYSSVSLSPSRLLSPTRFTLCES